MSCQRWGDDVGELVGWSSGQNKQAYKNIHKIQMIRIFGFLMHPQHPLFQK